MTKQTARSLAAILRHEAAEAGIRHLYEAIQAANADTWAVQEMDGMDGCKPIQVWVSPELSFPLV